MQDKIKKILIEGSKVLGICFSQIQLELFLKYLDILSRWNKKINLTSIRAPREICIKHFLDSLTSLTIINFCMHQESNKKKETNIIDVGSGAGFPGVPIKIMLPSIKLTLLEAKRKKTVFLAELVKELDLTGIEIVNNRAEVIGKKENFREAFDISISRAVAPLTVLSEYALPLVKRNGWFIALKGKEYSEELKRSTFAIELLGGKLTKIEKIQLPILNQERNIVLINKIKNTPNKYPRGKGHPKKRPLNI